LNCDKIHWSMTIMVRMGITIVDHGTCYAKLYTTGSTGAGILIKKGICIMFFSKCLNNNVYRSWKCRALVNVASMAAMAIMLDLETLSVSMQHTIATGTRCYLGDFNFPSVKLLAQKIHQQIHFLT